MPPTVPLSGHLPSQCEFRSHVPLADAHDVCPCDTTQLVDLSHPKLTSLHAMPASLPPPSRRCHLPPQSHPHCSLSSCSQIPVTATQSQLANPQIAQATRRPMPQKRITTSCHPKTATTRSPPSLASCNNELAHLLLVIFGLLSPVDNKRLAFDFDPRARRRTSTLPFTLLFPMIPDFCFSYDAAWSVASKSFDLPTLSSCPAS